jgi:hypothetical protein
MEYKEFFIALTMFVYALEVLEKVKKLLLKKQQLIVFFIPTNDLNLI